MRITRFAAALTLAASLAVPAHAAGPVRSGSAGASLFDLAWSWLATAWLDKGYSIDPDGSTADGDKGYGIDPDGSTADGDKGFTIDPNGLTVQGADPRAASEEGDRGFGIDPNG